MALGEQFLLLFLCKLFGKSFQIEILFLKHNVISSVVFCKCAETSGSDEFHFDRTGKLVVGVNPMQLLVVPDFPAGDDVKEIFAVQAALDCVFSAGDIVVITEYCGDTADFAGAFKFDLTPAPLCSRISSARRSVPVATSNSSAIRRTEFNRLP